MRDAIALASLPAAGGERGNVVFHIANKLGALVEAALAGSEE